MSKEAAELEGGPAGCEQEHVQQKGAVHIVLVPFQSEGHVNGMLGLAQALAAQGVIVTFVYPLRFHTFAHKRNKLSAQNHSSLRVEVVEDGLPLDEDQALTPDLMVASIPIFQNAVKLLLHNLLHQSKPCYASLPPACCLISDTFVPWTQDLADAATLPRVDFWTSTAAVYAMGCRLSSLISNGILPLPKSCWADSTTKWSADAPLIDTVPGLPPFPVTDLPMGLVLSEEASDLRVQFMLTAFGRVREAHTILVHSVYEMESQVFDALQSDGFPIHAVGPLLDSHIEPATSIQSNMAKHECLIWLDKQPPSSVIYVALGTRAKLNTAEMHALALGLEASGHPFLWVIRQDATAGMLYDTLPKGFLQRTTEKGSGLIVSWAPQTEVLHHHAIGVFFSHCGWNSTLECIWEGVPMVACPREAEQRSNERWIVENWKIGVRLERQVDGSFTMEAVQRALESVQGPTYKEMALRARKLIRSAIQKGGTSHSNLVSFLQCCCQSSQS